MSNNWPTVAAGSIVAGLHITLPSEAAEPQVITIGTVQLGLIATNNNSSGMTYGVNVDIEGAKRKICDALQGTPAPPREPLNARPQVDEAMIELRQKLSDIQATIENWDRGGAFALTRELQSILAR